MTTIPDTVSEFLDDCLDADLQARDAREAADPVLLTWHHPRFGEFAERVAARLSQRPRPYRAGFPVSRLVLQQMGGFDVTRSLQWLERHGGMEWTGAACGDRNVLAHVVGWWKRGPHAIEEQERYRRADCIYYFGDRGETHRREESDDEHPILRRTDRGRRGPLTRHPSMTNGGAL